MVWHSSVRAAKHALKKKLYSLCAGPRQLLDSWRGYRSEGGVALLVDVPRSDAEAIATGVRPVSPEEWVNEQTKHAAAVRQSLLDLWHTQAMDHSAQFLATMHRRGQASSHDAHMVPGFEHGVSGFIHPVEFDMPKFNAACTTQLSLQLIDVGSSSLQALVAFFLRFAPRRQRLVLRFLVAEARQRARRRALRERKAEYEAEVKRLAEARKTAEKDKAREALQKRKREFFAQNADMIMPRGVLNEAQFQALRVIRAHEKAKLAAKGERTASDAVASKTLGTGKPRRKVSGGDRRGSMAVVQGASGINDSVGMNDTEGLEDDDAAEQEANALMLEVANLQAAEEDEGDLLGTLAGLGLHSPGGEDAVGALRDEILSAIGIEGGQEGGSQDDRQGGRAVPRGDASTVSAVQSSEGGSDLMLRYGAEGDDDAAAAGAGGSPSSPAKARRPPAGQ